MLQTRPWARAACQLGRLHVAMRARWTGGAECAFPDSGEICRNGDTSAHGLAPGRAIRRCRTVVSRSAMPLASPGLFFCECQRCEIVAAVPTTVRLGLGMDELWQLPVVSSASGPPGRWQALAVGSSWRHADRPSFSDARPRQPAGVSKRLRRCWSVAPNLRRQAGWESSGFGICGWTGRPPLGSCTPKILLRRPFARMPLDDFPQTGDHLPPSQAHLSDP